MKSKLVSTSLFLIIECGFFSFLLVDFLSSKLTNNRLFSCDCGYKINCKGGVAMEMDIGSIIMQERKKSK